MRSRLLLGILVILGVAGLILWQMNNEKPSQQTQLILYGNIDIREVRLAFNSSEHVSEILVDEGDRVQRGQLLARLHTERLLTVEQRALADVAAAEAEAHVARLSYQRIQSLAARKLAAKEEADEAEGKSRAAAAHLAAAKASLAEIRQQLKDTEMHAPDNGVIRERIVEVGDFVTPQTPVLTLALLNPVWVRTYVPETHLGQIKPGTPASIQTDSFPEKQYQGWVGSISPTAEFTPKNVETPELRTRLVYQMRVFACNPQFELRLGMPATVSISLAENTDPSAVSIPDKRCEKQGARQP